MAATRTTTPTAMRRVTGRHLVPQLYIPNTRGRYSPVASSVAISVHTRDFFRSYRCSLAFCKDKRLRWADKGAGTVVPSKGIVGGMMNDVALL